jgi:hypothetical protein
VFVKVFAQILDSSIAEDYLVRLVFEDLLKLANSDGVVDMTTPAIARRTNVPLEIVARGIEVLSQPDKESRSPDEEGRRIVLLDAHRPWGWRIVNYLHYRNIRDEEGRRAYMRDYMRNRRNIGKPDVNSVNSSESPLANAEEEAEAEAEGKKSLCAALVPIAPLDVVISIPLNNGSDHQVTKPDVDEWTKLYPAVDVLQELRSYKGWASANPKKRKTKRGIKNSINSWLANAQDRNDRRNSLSRHSRTQIIELPTASLRVRMWGFCDNGNNEPS